MANSFKSFSFDKIVKKFTLCGLCDGKLNENSIFLCGCEEIFCSFCGEKHICKHRSDAIKYDSYRNSKSISFIHDLAELVQSNQHERGSGKAKDSSELEEETFSQLFDDLKNSQNKDRSTSSGSKRESISPRISYAQKRNRFLSDSEDEDIVQKYQTLSKNTSSDNLNSAKRKAKKRKSSSITKECDLVSSPLSSFNSHLKDGKEHLKKTKIKHELTCGSFTPSNKLNTFTDTFIPLPQSHPCSLPEDNVHLTDKNDWQNNSCSINLNLCNESVNKTTALIKNEAVGEVLPTSIESAIVNKMLVKIGRDEVEVHSLQNETKHLGDSELIDVNNSLTGSYLHEVPSNGAEIRMNATYGIESTCYNLKNSLILKKNKKNIDHEKVLNIHNQSEFRGFDQFEINASTLNLMLYKLTSTSIGIGTGVFPINHNGKIAFIHIGKKLEAAFNENEDHFLLTRISAVKNGCAQTGSDLKANTALERENSLCIKQTQTEECLKKDACNGSEELKNQDVQTEPCLFKEQLIGPGSRCHIGIETDSYQIENVQVGPESRCHIGVETDSYHVKNVKVGRESKCHIGVETDSYQVRNVKVGPESKCHIGVETDSYHVKNVKVGSLSSDVLVSNRNEHNSSVNQLSVVGGIEATLCTENKHSESPAESSENDDNEEDIIEGTPVKSNNMSFSSLDLSTVKERTLHFELSSDSPQSKKNGVISCSDLTNEEKEVVKKFTKYFGMEYAEYFTNKTTHLVVSSRLSHHSHKTFKYLMAIASKAYIVSMMWVMDSLQVGNLLPVDGFVPTNCAGPVRCRMNTPPPFIGLAICSQLLTNYPGIRAMEALCRLCGAFVIENIEVSCTRANWPFPRFCLFENESDLTIQILKNCQRNLILAVNFSWVFDSVAAFKRVPIVEHLCSTFNLTDDIVKEYKIPRDMILHNTDLKDECY